MIGQAGLTPAVLREIDLALKSHELIKIRVLDDDRRRRKSLLPEICTALAAHGGHATLIRADAALRATIEVFQPQPEALARLSARIKESFDPERILNRGRMYAGI